MKKQQDPIAVIIASRPVTAGMRQYVPQNAYIITADAGWKNAQAMGLLPDLALGDFDSSVPPPKAGEYIYLPAEKDDTDTHFAAREALRRGYKHIRLLGTMGGRVDHAHANLQTMLYLAQQGAQVVAVSEERCIWCIGPGVLRLPAQGWRWLSVFAAGGSAEGVSIQGTKYAVKNATLTPEMPIGVSNEFAAPEAEIGCEKGYLYVILESEQIP